MKTISFVFAALSLLTLGLTILFFRSLDVYIAISCAFACDIYVFALQSGSTITQKFAPRSSLPTILFLVVFLPLVVGLGLDFTGRLGGPFVAISQVLLMIGFAITFFFASFAIPLAIRHKRLEEKVKEDPNYKPLVSIIVPAYNEQAVISRTLESLVNLKYEKKEILVVDDGSTDKTNLIASYYKSQGVKVLRKPNGGKASALNYGLVFSKGEIVITVDADTMVTRGAIEEVTKIMANPSIVAVSGNIMVLNNKSFLTRLQELEYLVNLNIVRRALDLFGAVMVVPGAFGAFKKYAVENTGSYDKDTLTEDFDLTIKVLKAYGAVGASSTATAFTEVPATGRALYKQRLRWTMGIYQVMFKHADAFSNNRYGYLQKIVFPLLLLSFIMPFAGFLTLGAGIFLILRGHIIIFAELLFVFFLVQLFVVLLSISLDRNDYGLAWYTPLFVLGYKQFLDAVTVISILRVDLGARKQWSRTERVGGPIPVRVKG
jgi:cellulose synthase/poly-beta-1,6-N-acetylglucosamine synthase-like glycosyltransferase